MLTEQDIQDVVRQAVASCPHPVGAPVPGGPSSVDPAKIKQIILTVLQAVLAALLGGGGLNPPAPQATAPKSPSQGPAV